MKEPAPSMKNPEVAGNLTIVIPAYNRGHQVGTTLATLESQTCRPAEVILVDNNSTDDTLAVLQKWASEMNEQGWKVSVLTELRPGAASARRKGLEKVRTEYVAFFDSDDRMLPGYIKRIVEDIAEDPSYDLIVWSIRFVDKEGKKVAARRVLPPHPVENHMIQGLLSTLGYAVRTSFLRKAGGWNSDIGGWDDWELGVRLLLAEPKMKINREVRAEAIVQEVSMTGLNFSHGVGDWERTMEEVERVLRNGEMTGVRRHMLRLLAYRRVNLAAHYKREGLDETARNLREAGLRSPDLNGFQRLILRVAYLYTSKGFPFAGALFPPLLRK